MRVLTTFIMLWITAPAFVSTGLEKDHKIDDRIEQLRQTLLTRRSPAFLLVPSLDEQNRSEQSSRVMRPYVSLQFNYNLADLRWKGEGAAELPVRVHWETARVDGSLSGTMKLARIGDDWYFRSFDFLLFPWGEVTAAALLAVAFTVGVFLIYRRLRNRKRVTSAPLGS